MSTRTITVTDPREFEGDPYQVAQRAIQQAAALAALLHENLYAVDLMARNAELERHLSASVDAASLRATANAWPESPQGRRIAQIRADILAAEERLRGMEKAAAYNPTARSSR